MNENKSKIWAEVWNATERIKLYVVDGDYNALQNVVVQHLEKFPNARMVYESPEETVEFYYAADIDPQRGRFYATGSTAADAAEELQKTKNQYNKLRCFTPRELYDLKATKVTSDTHHLLSVHLRYEINLYDIDTDRLDATGKIEIKTLADECSDGRRTWTLETVWFQGCPVMVVNSSGRDGDENHHRYITDRELFELMISFIQSFRTIEHIDGLVELDAVIPDMTEFYSSTLHEYYDVEKQERKTPQALAPLS